MQESIWFTTRSALFRGGDAAWEAVAAYEQPLGRLIARRYPWVKPQDREDLVQDLLVEVQGKLVERHDPGRGPFRALLQAVVQRRVVDLVRRRSPAALEERQAADLAAPPVDELEALDLEAHLIEALAACRDRFTQGKERDPDVLYALADKIVHGLSVAEIALKNAVSVDRVNRLLKRGRDEVLRHLAATELGLAQEDPRLPGVVEAFREALRSPRELGPLLERIRDVGLRERTELLLRRFFAGAARFGGSGELQRGIALALGRDA